MKLRELFESKRKVAVTSFGRMNPPTIGHEKLVNAITKYNGDHFLFLSHTQRPNDNPLPYDIKSKFAAHAFPQVTVGDTGVRTASQMMQKLQSLGYTDIIFVVGEDRVEAFTDMVNTYNNKPNKSGKIEFSFNSIQVVNAGYRDPDAAGAEGMSASKMRAIAAEGNINAFAAGLPTRLKPNAKEVMNAVRTGMGVKNTITSKETY